MIDRYIPILSITKMVSKIYPISLISLNLTYLKIDYILIICDHILPAINTIEYTKTSLIILGCNLINIIKINILHIVTFFRKY